MKTLLWLDAMRNPFQYYQDGDTWHSQFSPIRMPYETVWVKSFLEFTKWITKNGLPDGICFDHDLGEDVAKEKVSSDMNKKKAREEKGVAKSGMDCAKWIVEYCLDNNLKLPPYNIQSSNPAGKANIDSFLYSFMEF